MVAGIQDGGVTGIPGFWLHGGPAAVALSPLAALYRGVIRLRRAAYRRGWLSTVRLPVPVLVVGNIFIGGSGKTPLAIWLVERLHARGYRPGVILRGYGGRAAAPCLVGPDSDPEEVGDEAVLIARRTGAPVAVGARRPEAGRLLLEHHEVDLIVADDGLQHYRLERDAEIVVIDTRRGLGNGRCLPAGPLREPSVRLGSVDLVIGNGEGGGYGFRLVPGELQAVGGRPRSMPPRPGETVHGVAGIGNPERFFEELERLGFDVVRHAYPDHHRFAAADLRFDDGRAVVMTEKDAVKCGGFGMPGLWFLPVAAQPSPALVDALDALIARILGDGPPEGSNDE